MRAYGWCFVAAMALAGCQWGWDRFEPVDDGAAGADGATSSDDGSADASADAGNDAGGDAVFTCGAGLSLCGGTCVDLDSDPVNCGACATSCGALSCRHARCR